MDFPIDPHQLAALERQKTATRGIQQNDTEFRLEPAGAPATGSSRWPARAVWAVATVAIGGKAAYFYSTRLRHRVVPVARQPVSVSAPASTLGFRVERQGSDLLLSWDRRSPSIMDATFGLVLIRENARTRNVALTPEQLRSGSVRYQPASDEVDIELNVAAGDRLLKESVIAELP